MATPVNVIYTGPSPIHAGFPIAIAYWTGDWAKVGDSLTDGLYDIDSSRWGLSRTLLPPLVLWNAGKSGDSVAGVAGRLQTIIDDWPTAKNFLIRIGTNGAYDATTYQANFQAIFNILASNNKRGCFLAIPPSTRGGTTPGVNSTFVAENAWLAAQCAANPTYLKFIYDSDALGDSNYNNTGSYTVDGVHQNPLAEYIQGEAERLGFLDILPTTSPLITDGTDIYPANSASNQWVQNPLMLGGDATTLPTGWFWDSYGTSVTGTMGVHVDGDGTRWLRMAVTSATNGYGTLRTNLLHPALNADMNTVKRLDTIIEMRRTTVDVVRGGSVDLQVWSSDNQRASISHAPGLLPASGILTDRAVLRTSSARNQADSAITAVPIAQAANSLKLIISLSFTGSAGSGGNVGIFDFRCASVRGSLT